MRVLVLCGLVASLAAPAAGQTHKPMARSAPRAKPAGPVKAAEQARFSAAGLNNEDDLVRIYSGDFGAVRLDRASMEFMLIISGYMNDFAKGCKQFLPPNKVEIMQQVCSGGGSPAPYTPDGIHDAYGNLLPTSSCTYVTVGTGLYADPQLYDAVKDVSAKAQMKMVGDMLGMGKRGTASNLFTAPQQMVDQLTAVGNEMQTLIRTNSCGSVGLRNFQGNLVRFANGENPVKFAGAVASGPAPTATADAGGKDTDFTRLLDDLVAANARGWMMNRYQAGSITDPIVSHDPLGHPVRVMARYSFTGMQGTQQGHVTVSFKDGAPDCLYFSDAPDTCRLPAQGVVSAYEKNAYAK